MARRLSYQNLILGLAIASTAVSCSTAYAQTTPPASSSKSAGENRAVAQPQEKNHDDKHDGDERREGRGRGDGGPGDGRGNGGRGNGRFGVDFFLEALKSPEFLMEVCKRDGGPLEFLAPLMKPEVRELLKLSPEHTAAADKFLADMTKHFEEDITEFKKQGKPISELKSLFDERLKTENTSFEEFLKGLSVEQQDRLIGIFVQYRNHRALSNRVVAEKAGLGKEDAAKLAKEISDIRRDVVQESGELARRQIQNGKTLNETQNKEHWNKMRTKIDQRIEKLVSKEQLEKFNALRGKSLPPELIEKLDRFPPQPPSKRD